MTIYNLYIFDRNGTCLAYQAWNRKKESNMSQDEVSEVFITRFAGLTRKISSLFCSFYIQEFKLMYGMLYSIKSFVNRMSPFDWYPFCWDAMKYALLFIEELGNPREKIERVVSLARVSRRFIQSK